MNRFIFVLADKYINIFRKKKFYDGKIAFRRASEASDSFFFAISAHPRARKACFRCFLLIRGLGRLVFGVFCSSEASDSLFFVISVHPRPRTACFWCFLLIRGLGKLVFGIFFSSEGSERQFLLFSARRRGTKCSFSRFLLIVGVRRLLFWSFPRVYRLLGNATSPVGSCSAGEVVLFFSCVSRQLGGGG